MNMNKPCRANNDAMHGFYTTLAPIFTEGPFKAQAFITCISCGARRAIDKIGQLWEYDADKGEWAIRTDAVGAAQEVQE